MSVQNKYFDSSLKRSEHPRIRAWQSYRKSPGVDSVGVDILRERDGLTVLPARLFVYFYGQDGSIIKDDEANWEPDLEDWLIDNEKAKAVSMESEKLRFSLLLKPLLRPALVRYGDGYFNSVLIDELRNGPYAAHRDVASMLQQIHEAAPLQGQSLDDCRKAVEDAIKNAAQRILKLYNEDLEKAEDILGGAIAQYLDDRFSITNRRLLGFL